MNNARLVMVAGLTAILGMYTIGLQRPGASMGVMAGAEAIQLQAKQIARAGVGLSVQRLTSLGLEATSVESLPMLGGSLTYSIAINPDSSSATVVAVGSYDGHAVQLSAWVDKVTATRWVLRREHWQRVDL